MEISCKCGSSQFQKKYSFSNCKKCGNISFVSRTKKEIAHDFEYKYLQIGNGIYDDSIRGMIMYVAFYGIVLRKIIWIIADKSIQEILTGSIYNPLELVNNADKLHSLIIPDNILRDDLVLLWGKISRGKRVRKHIKISVASWKSFEIIIDFYKLSYLFKTNNISNYAKVRSLQLIKSKKIKKRLEDIDNRLKEMCAFFAILKKIGFKTLQDYLSFIEVQ